MKFLHPEFTFFCGGTKFIDGAKQTDKYELRLEVTHDGAKASVTAKKTIRMHRFDLAFEFPFEPDDRFFSNGYQSWTTSREYTVNDRMRDIIPIAKGKLKKLAGISADVEGVALNPGDEYELFDLAFLRGTYDEVFDEYFRLMGVKKPRISHMSGYTSWYNYFQKIDEKTMLRDLNALDIVKDSVSIFQIDDGYEPFVGDWCYDNPEKFPKGMKYIADAIHDKGYMAGIWLAPFSVQIKSRTYKEHPDWVLRYPDSGKPILGCAGWGGAYTLDIYNEEARAYIRDFFDMVLNVWGYDMVKLDFLYSACMYPRGNKSRGTLMCEAMDFLRECVGDKLILGCGVPLGAAFGRVDACRISCDVDLKYEGKFYNKLGVNNEIPSAQNAINNSIFRRHLDGRVFCNDPDVLFLRYSNLTFTTEQKVLLATVNHIFGNVLFVSDNAEEYKGVDVDTLRKVFAKSDFKVLDANYVSDEDITVELEKDGKKQILAFNIRTGKSNVEDIIGVPTMR